MSSGADAVRPDAGPEDPGRPGNAADALALSRSRLRASLMRERTPPGAVGPRWARSASGIVPTRWRDALKSLPLAGVALEGVSAWWAQHPMRVAVNLAAAAAQAIAQPMARRHPVGLIVASAVFGAAIVRSRPWRWLLKPALFAGLLPHLLSRLAAARPVLALVHAATESKPESDPTSPPAIRPISVDRATSPTDGSARPLPPR